MQEGNCMGFNQPLY